MEMMKMQQTAGFKLHSCRQKRDEEVRMTQKTHHALSQDRS